MEIIKHTQFEIESRSFGMFIMDMTAIILAGGLATRMGEVCYEVPKAMLEFDGYPFLQYVISWLIGIGFSEILISMGRLSHKIEELFATDFWKSRGVRIIKEANPLGTGGAVRFASEHALNEELFLCNGDTAVSIDFSHLLEAHKTIDTSFTAILTLLKDVPNQGAVSVENGIITEFSEGEKPREPIYGEHSFRGSSTGCYFMKRSSILRTFPIGCSSLEREILPGLVSRRLVGALNGDVDFFFDFGTPERYHILKNDAWVLNKTYGELITEGSKDER